MSYVQKIADQFITLISTTGIHANVKYVLGMCDNGKTYISIMYGKIILITIVISINDNKSIVHVFEFLLF